jgi:tRNA(Ile2) C34 agmatinyltransferase TiaS
MEEGRGMAWESLERGVRRRGYEVWKMEEGGGERGGGARV